MSLGGLTGGLTGGGGPLNSVTDTAGGLTGGVPGGLGGVTDTAGGLAGGLPGGLGGITDTAGGLPGGLPGGLLGSGEGLNLAGLVGIGSDEKALLALNPAEQREVKAQKIALAKRREEQRNKLIKDLQDKVKEQGGKPTPEQEQQYKKILEEQASDEAEMAKLDKILAEAEPKSDGSALPGAGAMPGGGALPGGDTFPGDGTFPGGGTLPGSGAMPGGGTFPGGGAFPGSGAMPASGATPGSGAFPGDGAFPGGGAMPGGGIMPTNNLPTDALPTGNGLSQASDLANPGASDFANGIRKDSFDFANDTSVKPGAGIPSDVRQNSNTGRCVCICSHNVPAMPPPGLMYAYLNNCDHNTTGSRTHMLTFANASVADQWYQVVGCSGVQRITPQFYTYRGNPPYPIYNDPRLQNWGVGSQMIATPVQANGCLPILFPQTADGYIMPTKGNHCYIANPPCNVCGGSSGDFKIDKNNPPAQHGLVTGQQGIAGQNGFNNSQNSFNNGQNGFNNGQQGIPDGQQGSGTGFGPQGGGMQGGFDSFRGGQQGNNGQNSFGFDQQGFGNDQKGLGNRQDSGSGQQGFGSSYNPGVQGGQQGVGGQGYGVGQQGLGNGQHSFGSGQQGFENGQRGGSGQGGIGNGGSPGFQGGQQGVGGQGYSKDQQSSTGSAQWGNGVTQKSSGNKSFTLEEAAKEHASLLKSSGDPRPWETIYRDALGDLKHSCCGPSGLSQPGQASNGNMGQTGYVHPTGVSNPGCSNQPDITSSLGGTQAFSPQGSNAFGSTGTGQGGSLPGGAASGGAANQATAAQARQIAQQQEAHKTVVQRLEQMHRAQGGQFTPEQKQQYDRSVTAYKQLDQKKQNLTSGSNIAGSGGPLDAMGGVTNGLPTNGVTNGLPTNGATNSLPTNGLSNGLPLGAADGVTNSVGGLSSNPLDTATGAAGGLPGPAGGLTKGLGGLPGGDGGGPLNSVTGAAGGLGDTLGGVTGGLGGLTGGGQGLNVAGLVGVGSDEKAAIDLNPGKKTDVKQAEEVQRQQQLDQKRQELKQAQDTLAKHQGEMQGLLNKPPGGGLPPTNGLPTQGLGL